MNTILLAVIAVLLIILSALVISLLLELRRTAASLRKTTEEELRPALEELAMILKGFRNVSETAVEIASDIRRFSKSVSNVGRAVETVSEVAQGLSSFTTVRAMSLKAGMWAAMEYFVRNLISKGDRK